MPHAPRTALSRTTVPASGLRGAGIVRQDSAALTRVGFITPSLLLGGAERWVLNLAEYLGPRCTPSGVAICTNRATDEHLRRARHIFPRVLRADDRHGNHTSRRAVRELAAHCDVLLAWGLATLPELVRGLDLPVVLCARSSFESPRCVALLARAAAGATHFAAVSEAARDAWPERFRGQVRVLDNGVDLRRLEPRRGRVQTRRRLADGGLDLRPDDPLILSIARLAPEKRLELILSAAQRLMQRGERWRVLLVGPDKGCGHALLSEIRRYLPRGAAALHPPVDAIGDLLAAADVFVVPSRYEGTPQSLVEAIAAGVPSVTCAYAAAAELQRRVRCLRSVGVEHRPEELAAAIRGAAVAGRQNEAVRRGRLAARAHYSLPAAAARWDEWLSHIATVSREEALT